MPASCCQFLPAYELVSSDLIIEGLRLPLPIDPFEKFSALPVLIPVSPLVLKPGFTIAPDQPARRHTLWALFKGCFYISLGPDRRTLFSRLLIARFVPIGFGVFAFILGYLKEELVLLAAKRASSQNQFRRRFIPGGHARRNQTYAGRNPSTPGIWRGNRPEIDLNKIKLEDFVNLLHEHAINGVILSTRHTHFDRAELVVNACELEGLKPARGRLFQDQHLDHQPR